MSSEALKDLELAKYLMMVREAEEGFLGFVKLHHPLFNWAPFQLDLIDALDRLEKGILTNDKGQIIHNLMINMPPRHGKLMADSTAVLTTKGFKTHGELQVGDTLFTPHGTTTNVVALSPPGMAFLNVTFSNGSTFKVHPRHEWTTRDAVNPSHPERGRETQWYMQLSPAMRRMFYVRQVRDPEVQFLDLWIKNEVHPPVGRLYIESIEFSTPEIGRCIQVDAPDGQYLVGHGMVPTHNSFLASWLFPAYYLARNPKRSVLATSYNDTLAKDFGRKTRNYAMEPVMQQAFPEFGVSEDTRAADFWQTTHGGQYAGVGMGGTTTGRPANLLLIDDPVRNRQDAESPTRRNTVWDFYGGSLMNRKEPLGLEPPIEIVILTRWHPDDLAGRIQESEDWKEGYWKHIELPAIRTGKPKLIARNRLPEDDPDFCRGEEYRALASVKRSVERTEEVALWPERFSLESLKRLKRMNEREFTALYMQKPYIRGGNRIKLQWWRFYENAPDMSEFVAIVVGTDTAFKTSSENDYSAFVVGGLHQNGDIYILDVIRGKWDFPSLKRAMMNINLTYRGRGLRAFYIEDKASGQSLIQEMRANSGVSVVPVKVVHDKITRVDLVSGLIEGGRVLLPKEASWLDPFLDELCAFPSGTNDDQVDAFVIVLDQLSRTGINDQMMLNSPLSLDNSLFKQVERTAGKLDTKGSLNSLSPDARVFKWGG